jgi:hypothetical protein
MIRFALGRSLTFGLIIFLLRVPTAISDEPASETDAAAFKDDWQVLAILGDTAQIRDYLGVMHYAKEGEELNGVEIVELNPLEMTIRVRDPSSGREKVISAAGTPPMRSDRRSERKLGEPTRPGFIHRMASDTPRGLDTKLEDFWVSDLPIRQLLRSLSHEAGFGYVVVREVEELPVTARLSGLTVRQILEAVLPAYGCAWESVADGRVIAVTSNPRPDLTNAIRIAPDSENQPPESIAEDKPEMKTKVFDLKYVAIENVGPVLTQLKSPDGTLFIITKQRRIVAADYPENLEQMARTVHELDCPTIRRVFRLKYINAEEARQQLQPVLSQKATLQVDPVNNALIIEDVPSNVTEAEAIIADLDRHAPSSTTESPVRAW